MFVCEWCVCAGRCAHLLSSLFCAHRAVVRFVPPVSGSEVTCELEFTIPEDDTFFDDKVCTIVLANVVASESWLCN